LFLYNTGARASEAAGLTVTAVILDSPGHVRLLGKGIIQRWKTSEVALDGDVLARQQLALFLSRLELVRRCWLRRKAKGPNACRRSCKLGCDALRIEPAQDVGYTRGVRKVIAEILPQIRGDSQLETACLNGQSGDQCFRSRFSFSSR
jgi:hypothetical protein